MPAISRTLPATTAPTTPVSARHLAAGTDREGPFLAALAALTGAGEPVGRAASTDTEPAVPGDSSGVEDGSLGDAARDAAPAADTPAPPAAQVTQEPQTRSDGGTGQPGLMLVVPPADARVMAAAAADPALGRRGAADVLATPSARPQGIARPANPADPVGDWQRQSASHDPATATAFVAETSVRTPAGHDGSSLPRVALPSGEGRQLQQATSPHGQNRHANGATSVAQDDGAQRLPTAAITPATATVSPPTAAVHATALPALDASRGPRVPIDGERDVALVQDALRPIPRPSGVPGADGSTNAPTADDLASDRTGTRSPRPQVPSTVVATEAGPVRAPGMAAGATGPAAPDATSTALSPSAAPATALSAPDPAPGPLSGTATDARTRDLPDPAVAQATRDAGSPSASVAREAGPGTGTGPGVAPGAQATMPRTGGLGQAVNSSGIALPGRPAIIPTAPTVIPAAVQATGATVRAAIADATASGDARRPAEPARVPRRPAARPAADDLEPRPDGASSTHPTAGDGAPPGPTLLAGPGGTTARALPEPTRLPQPPAGQPAQPLPVIEMQDGAAVARIEPDELGRIDIRVERGDGDGDLAIVLRAERPESAALMRRHADLLQRELADSGVGHARIDVTSAQGASAGGPVTAGSSPQSGTTLPPWAGAGQHGAPQSGDGGGAQGDRGQQAGRGRRRVGTDTGGFEPGTISPSRRAASGQVDLRL